MFRTAICAFEKSFLGFLGVATCSCGNVPLPSRALANWALPEHREKRTQCVSGMIRFNMTNSTLRNPFPMSKTVSDKDSHSILKTVCLLYVAR